jgi:hypothetical protein
MIQGHCLKRYPRSFYNNMIQGHCLKRYPRSFLQQYDPRTLFKTLSKVIFATVWSKDIV